MTKIPRLKQFQISQIIVAHCHPVEGAEGFCRYDEGWNDEKVRAEVNDPTIKVSHVRGLRMDILGKVRENRATTPTTLAPDPRVDILVERFNALIDELESAQLLTARKLKINGDLLNRPSSSPDPRSASAAPAPE